MSKTSKNLGSSVLITLETKFVDIFLKFEISNFRFSANSFAVIASSMKPLKT
jgi:hypothetical protein